MNHRYSPIAAYYNKETKTVHCRVCNGVIINTLIFKDTCYRMQCCSSHDGAETTSRFKFDNTHCDIIISEIQCTMCNYHNRNCLVLFGHECPFNIPRITKDFANIVDVKKHLRK